MHHEGADHDHDPYRENRLESTHHHCPGVDRAGSGLRLAERSEIAPGEDHCSLDCGRGIAEDHPKACHRVEGRRIGLVSREDPNCSPVEGGCGRGVGDEVLKLGVVEVDLLVVSHTANMCGLEVLEPEQRNRLERAVGELVEAEVQVQKVDIGIVGQERAVAELEEGVGQSGAIAAVAAVAAAKQGHNHS